MVVITKIKDPNPTLVKTVYCLICPIFRGYAWRFEVNYILLVRPVPLAQVLPCPELNFPSKTWFFGNLFEFSAAEIT
jgi:hypothetical protein